jgi:putative tryptophan/tyrosine transport system substrate-binding protein
MRRRDFLAGMGGFIAPIHCANAQQRPVPIIGFLSSLPQASGRNRPGFLEGLAEIGFIEGTSVGVEYRWADGDYSRLPTLASEFVQEKVAVIVAEYLPAALAAKETTGTIPIIFVSGADPVKFGLVTSFNAPSGNATGVFQYFGPLNAKRLELLRELLPHASTVALLLNPTNPNADHNLEDVEAAALSRGLSPRVFRASTPKDVIDAFSHPQMGSLHAMLVIDDPFLGSQNKEIVHRAARHSIPVMFVGRTGPTLGGLMSYGASSAHVNRLVGVYVGRILRGEKPSDLPVLLPTNFELVINVKTAAALGLTIPPTLLARADEVIE